MNREKSVPATGCLFCGRLFYGPRREPGQVKRSREHIWPDWIRKHAGQLPDFRVSHAAVSQISLTGQSVIQMAETSTSKSSVLNLRTPVCEECNTGWMSRLETAGKPHILAAAAAAEANAPIVLSRGEARTLAMWAEKTALTNELTTNWPKVAGPAMGQRLRQGAPVRGSLVWAARHPADFMLSIALVHLLVGRSRKPVPGEVDRHVMLTAITYHYVTFLILLTSTPMMPPPMSFDHWCRIWPVTGSVSFPPLAPVESSDLTSRLLDHSDWLPSSQVETFSRFPSRRLGISLAATPDGARSGARARRESAGALIHYGSIRQQILQRPRPGINLWSRPREPAKVS